MLVFYDEPGDLEGDPKTSWEAVREGILDGARASSVPVVVSSTLPELLQDDSAARFVAAGVPAIAGLRRSCAAALAVDPGDSQRLREMAAFARRAGAPGAWLPEHEAKDLLRGRAFRWSRGVARDEDDAAAILAELGPPVAAKLSGEDLRHKSELGALALELVTEAEVRDAHGRLLALRSGSVLIERHAPPGVELLRVGAPNRGRAVAGDRARRRVDRGPRRRRRRTPPRDAGARRARCRGCARGC